MRLAWPRWRDRLTKPRLLLRPARDADVESLSDFYEACMRDYAEAFYPWDPHQFRETFRPGEIEVVEYRGDLAGLLKTQILVDHVYLADVQLAPRVRNRGVGTKLVKLTLERARVLDLPVRLRVLRNNPAHGLYARLGFEQVGEATSYLILQRAS